LWTSAHHRMPAKVTKETTVITLLARSNRNRLPC
jgi:hypothetical protein